jgi:PAS domain S-box-containing protein
MEKQKSSKPLKPSDKGKTLSDKKLRQPANPKRKKAEEEVERFASFPKLNPNPVLEVDSSGKITFHNDAAVTVLKKFHLSEDVSVFLPEDIQEILAGLKQKREGQYNRELILKGKVFEETIYLVPQFNTLRLYAVDITERTRAETALKVSESKYRSLFANMISGFAYHQIVLNRNGKPVDYIFLEINDAFEKLTGLKSENIIGKRVTEIIPGIENDPANWIGTFGKIALTGIDSSFENYSDAMKRWYSVAAYSPQKGYFVAIFDDITERKQAETALQESQARLEWVLEKTGVGTWLNQLPFGRLNWDVQTKRLFFVAPDVEPTIEVFWSRLHPADREPTRLAVEKAIRDHTLYDIDHRAVNPDTDEVRWIRSIGQATYADDGTPTRFDGINYEITERKLTEKALRESREDLYRAQAVARTGSWRLDVRKNELLWSDENWRIFEVPKGTALTYETFLSTIHPDDREYVDKQWSAALRGEPYDIEHRIVVDGQVKWVRERAELEFDADGTLKGGFGTTQDITEKKQAERDLQTLMEELKRSNSDLEQFAYAASHDLQEPLRVVAGFVSLLEKKYKEKLDDKAHEYIEYSIDGVKRMQVLIKDLLAYSQVGTKGKTFKPTVCSVALEQAIYNLHTAIEESGAEITYDCLPTVSADTSQLTRLFQNLIGNAIKFRGKERLKIHIAVQQKGNEWVFSIRDNGIGIDPKFFGRIFVVFQRLHTREEYEGTGIGLAVCKKIVERHGGHIWVESEQGKGTTFYFTMPVME